MHTIRILLLAALVALAGCSKGDDPAPDHRAGRARPATDPVKARKLMGEGAAVLDVRTPEEFEDGHVTGAINVPVQDLRQRLADVDRLVGGDRTRPVVVYCGAGSRAARAKQELESVGYTQVVNGGGHKDLSGP